MFIIHNQDDYNHMMLNRGSAIHAQDCTCDDCLKTFKLSALKPKLEEDGYCIHSKRHFCVECHLFPEYNMTALDEALGVIADRYPSKLIIERLAHKYVEESDSCMKSYFSTGDKRFAQEGLGY